MDDLKKGYREGETDTKEAWRNRDGTSVSDAIGNAGDEIRKHLGNAGDDADEARKRSESEADRDIDTGTTRNY